MKTIKIKITMTLLQRGLIKLSCHSKKEEYAKWLVKRWGNVKRERTIRVHSPFKQRRPKHTLVSIKFYRRGKLEARLLADSMETANRLGSIWKKNRPARSFEISNYRAVGSL